jgi:hypothetical protein
MKKILSIVIKLYFMTIFKVSAQTNLYFENSSGNEPNVWTKSYNFTQQNGGSQTIYKITYDKDQGKASLKIASGNYTDYRNFSIIKHPIPFSKKSEGSIQLGIFDKEGIPFTHRPISIDFKYKSNPNGIEAIGFIVELTKYNPITKDNEIVGEGFFKVNSKVTSWTSMNIPIVYYSSLKPDKLDIRTASSICTIPNLSAIGLPNASQLGLPISDTKGEFYLDAIVFNLPTCEGLNIAITGTNETFIGANDGTAKASPKGGTSPYSFLWSNLATNQSIDRLSPGYYKVTVTDANQCQKVGSYYVAPDG